MLTLLLTGFTYDGVAQNKLPNGEAFTIDGILRDDVIESALVELGLKDYYSVDSIRGSMMVKGSFPKDVIDRLSTYNSVYDYNVYRDVEEENYYPSVYTITLFDDYQ